MGTWCTILEIPLFQKWWSKHLLRSQKKYPSCKGYLFLKSSPNPRVEWKRYTMIWRWSVFPASSFITLSWTLGSILADALAVARMFHALSFSSDFYICYLQFLGIPQGSANVLSSGKHVPSRVKGFHLCASVVPWNTVLYTISYFMEFCVHIFLLH